MRVGKNEKNIRGNTISYESQRVHKAPQNLSNISAIGEASYTGWMTLHIQTNTETVGYL